MKEWAIKHPVMTFLLAASAIDGLVKIFRLTAYMVTGKEQTQPDTDDKAEEEEEA